MRIFSIEEHVFTLLKRSIRVYIIHVATLNKPYTKCQPSSLNNPMLGNGRTSCIYISYENCEPKPNENRLTHNGGKERTLQRFRMIKGATIRIVLTTNSNNRDKSAESDNNLPNCVRSKSDDTSKTKPIASIVCWYIFIYMPKRFLAGFFIANFMPH